MEIPVDVAVFLFASDEGGFDHRHRLGPVSECHCDERAGDLPSCNGCFDHRYAGVAQSCRASAPGDGGFTPGEGVFSPQDRNPAFSEGGLA